ncbi:MAG: hypothetical protein KBD00_00320 [Candidatus Peribacteraceae bacterium]|nr:hypothetical protein [Candidatus Peribacteraceae bacterium]
MSPRTKFSQQEIGALRDQAGEYLGKRIIFDHLTVPSVGRNIEKIQLITHGNALLVTSEIEIYPYLKEGGKYKKAFGDIREPESIFAFQMQGGLPAVSIVLPNQNDAIAVIKKLMTQGGEELPWSAVLERLHIDRLQFKGFVDVVDGILITRRNAQMRLETLKGMELESNLREQPKPDVANLDSVIHLSASSKRELREKLPEFLAAEQS